MYDIKAYLQAKSRLNLEQADLTQFPRNDIDYFEKYVEIEKYMNEQVHSHVSEGAASHGAGLLTDHGPAHVAMVIRRASQLLQERMSELSGFEVFVLLLAIHFHDVGNIYGRDEHERQISKVMNKCILPSFLDRALKRHVVKIAAAHGGIRADGSRDSIYELQRETPVNGLKIRPALLASILRFADELADDNTRTSELVGHAGAIPVENEIYHKYSACLQPVVVSQRCLLFQFDLKKEDVLSKYGKGAESCYLYDEILTRMKKCYCELIYCSQYAETFLNFSSLDVSIRVFDDDDMEVICEESYKLEIGGYPSYVLNAPIGSLPGEVHECLTGEMFKQKVELIRRGHG